jgi:hypothetical protein
MGNLIPGTGLLLKNPDQRMADSAPKNMWAAMRREIAGAQSERRD